MKFRWITYLWIAVNLWACDTPRKNQVETVAQDYVSPRVLAEPTALPPLPADSIPVAYSVKGVAVAPSSFQPMMGSWVSDFDESEWVRFLPGKYISYYDGQQVVEEKMVYYQVCPSICALSVEDNEKPCFVLSSPYGQTCFAILHHTPDQLQLKLLGEEETILSYHRKQEN
ncbi:MAG: hypothetical protein R2795_12605 [Saprospiraceae bacterium]